MRAVAKTRWRPMWRNGVAIGLLLVHLTVTLFVHGSHTCGLLSGCASIDRHSGIAVYAPWVSKTPHPGLESSGQCAACAYLHGTQGGYLPETCQAVLIATSESFSVNERVFVSTSLPGERLARAPPVAS